MESKLKPREKLFCLYYCQFREPRRAAALAGYEMFICKTAAKLMKRKDILSEIERLDKIETPSDCEVKSGYRRLAFGSCADAYKLLFSDDENSAPNFETLDLFNISEIKRPKNGGIEIKFFDRLKALEALGEMSADSETDKALPFYNVIEKSAAAIRGSDDVD